MNHFFYNDNDHHSVEENLPDMRNFYKDYAVKLLNSAAITGVHKNLSFFQLGEKLEALAVQGEDQAIELLKDIRREAALESKCFF